MPAANERPSAASRAATPAAVAGNTGNGTLASAAVGAGAKVGVYRATCIEPAANLGKFTVEDLSMSASPPSPPSSPAAA